MRWLLVLECLIRVIYFHRLLSKKSFKELIETANKSTPYFKQWVSDENLKNSFPIVRKLLKWTGNKNPCLLISLAYFSMLNSPGKFYISASHQQDVFSAHAWIELANEDLLTTDYNSLNHEAFLFEKIC